MFQVCHVSDLAVARLASGMLKAEQLHLTITVR